MLNAIQFELKRATSDDWFLSEKYEVVLAHIDAKLGLCRAL
jgi:hypothetical protein